MVEDIFVKEILGISKIRDVRKSLEIIIKTHMKTGTTGMITKLATNTKIGINVDTSIEMTAMTKIEVGLEKDVAYLKQGKVMTSQGLNESTKSYDS